MGERPHPPICPCRASPLAEEENEKGRYRELVYACGASGWFDETFDHGAVHVGDMQWRNACPEAMPAIHKRYELTGKALLNCSP